MGKQLKAAIIVFPGVEELDFVGVWEVLGALERFSEVHFKRRTVATTSDVIKCAHGLRALADEELTSLLEYDVVVVPGGPGVEEAIRDQELLTEVKRAYEAGKLVSSVCTGAFVLAEAGLLDGKRGTTYHTQLEKLAEYGVEVLRARVVVDGNIITGAGVTASIDVGLKIVEITLGNETARKAAECIEYPLYAQNWSK